MTREETLEAALEDAFEMIREEWGVSIEEMAKSGWTGKENLVEGAKLLMERHERVPE